MVRALTFLTDQAAINEMRRRKLADMAQKVRPTVEDTYGYLIHRAFVS
jgi:hypothetical protein